MKTLCIPANSQEIKSISWKNFAHDTELNHGVRLRGFSIESIGPVSSMSMTVINSIMDGLTSGTIYFEKIAVAERQKYQMELAGRGVIKEPRKKRETHKDAHNPGYDSGDSDEDRPSSNVEVMSYNFADS